MDVPSNSSNNRQNPRIRRTLLLSRLTSLNESPSSRSNHETTPNTESHTLDQSDTHNLSIFNSITELANYEAQNTTLSTYEDAKASHKRVMHNSHTSASCKLRCERGLPPTTARGDALLKYQARYGNLTGGFDPTSITRGNT